MSYGFRSDPPKQGVGDRYYWEDTEAIRAEYLAAMREAVIDAALQIYASVIIYGQPDWVISDTSDWVSEWTQQDAQPFAL